MNKRFSTLMAAVLVAGSFSSMAFAKDVLPNGERYYQLINSSNALTYEVNNGKTSLVVKNTTGMDLEALKKTLWSVKATGAGYEFRN